MAYYISRPWGWYSARLLLDLAPVRGEIGGRLTLKERAGRRVSVSGPALQSARRS
jgi:hypothetical protein